MYSDVRLHIAGEWREGRTGRTLPITNPATDEELGRLAFAETQDLDEALDAAQRGFESWRRVSAYDRSKILRRAAELLRERADTIARLMTLEQGKPLPEAFGETMFGADVIEWFAEEGRRTYGRIIPARSNDVQQQVFREPVGPVAAFTPWNFPINQAVRKISAALSSGCSIVLKGPEDTPASCAELVRAFLDAGVPSDVLSLVYGDPAGISGYLIPHPTIRKVSFTGSTAVGKQLAALAGANMKPATMELGGHAPAIVFDDADVDGAVDALVAGKYRNAGQVCIAPTRLMIQAAVYDRFVDGFVKASQAVAVGDGLQASTTMGPLVHTRRVEALESFVEDARTSGGRLLTGGDRLGNRGSFFAPTILTDVPLTARIMNEEPFGPVAVVQSFGADDEALAEANRLPYGLAAYAFTRSAGRIAQVGGQVRSGMISINHNGLALPETPFGGVADSGYGSEGGAEAMDPYLTTKFVTVAA